MGTVLGPRPPWDESREPILRSPRVVVAILVILIGIHAAMSLVGDETYNALFMRFAFVPARFAAIEWGALGLDLPSLLAVAPLVTYAFLHGDWVHVSINAVWFLAFATVVARRVGSLKFVLLCIVTAVGAVLTHLAFHWGEQVPVVGASGAVSGLMGAASRFIFLDPNRTPVWPPSRLSLTSEPVVRFAVLWVVVNLIFGLSGFSPDGFGRSVAWEAHLGGFFVGLLVFPLFDRQRSWIS